MGLQGSETQLQGCKDPLPEKRSRDIAVKKQSCLKKLPGAEGEHAEKSLKTIVVVLCTLWTLWSVGAVGVYCLE